MNNNFKSIFLMCMIIAGMGGLNLLGRINFLEPVHAGDELEIFTNVNNPTGDDMDDLSVRAIFFDLGEYVVSSEFDLDDGDTSGVKLSLDIPRGARSGLHLVKIVASNDDYYDSKYMYIRVI